jgi:hypothetical protein
MITACPCPCREFTREVPLCDVEFAFEPESAPDLLLDVPPPIISPLLRTVEVPVEAEVLLLPELELTVVCAWAILANNISIAAANA